MKDAAVEKQKVHTSDISHTYINNLSNYKSNKATNFLNEQIRVKRAGYRSQ